MSAGHPHAAATCALEHPTMDPTAGYPTPSTTVNRRPRETASTAAAHSASVSAAVAVSPARKARVKP